MKKILIFVGLAAIAVVAVVGARFLSSASALDYPTRPITMIVP